MGSSLLYLHLCLHQCFLSFQECPPLGWLSGRGEHPFGLAFPKDTEVSQPWVSAATTRKACPHHPWASVFSPGRLQIKSLTPTTTFRVTPSPFLVPMDLPGHLCQRLSWPTGAVWYVGRCTLALYYRGSRMRGRPAAEQPEDLGSGPNLVINLPYV